MVMIKFTRIVDCPCGCSRGSTAVETIVTNDLEEIAERIKVAIKADVYNDITITPE